VKKFEGVSLTMALAVAGAVGGCDRDQNKDWQASNQPTRVCVDQQGHRVPENQCGQPVHTGGGVSPFLWYYLGTLGARSYVPAYGGAVSGGSFAPAAGVRYGAAPAGGISRGGFGGTARSFGGVGGEAGAGE
jgi:hypothetical protein